MRNPFKSLRILVVALGALLGTSGILALAQTYPAAPGNNSPWAPVWSLVYDASTTKPTYSATGDVVLPSSPTDICTLTGSATKILKVRRVVLSGAANAVTSEPVALIKRSTANSGGTSSNIVKVGYDSAAPTATGTVLTYTVNPTLGTAVGGLTDPLLTYANRTTGTGAPLEIYFGITGGAVTLRGITQVLAVNFNGLTISGADVQCTFEWTEE